MVEGVCLKGGEGPGPCAKQGVLGLGGDRIRLRVEGGGFIAVHDRRVGIEDAAAMDTDADVFLLHGCAQRRTGRGFFSSVESVGINSNSGICFFLWWAYGETLSQNQSTANCIVYGTTITVINLNCWGLHPVIQSKFKTRSNMSLWS
jgi:hypothetical protein